MKYADVPFHIGMFFFSFFFTKDVLHNGYIFRPPTHTHPGISYCSHPPPPGGHQKRLRKNAVFYIKVGHQVGISLPPLTCPRVAQHFPVTSHTLSLSDDFASQIMPKGTLGVRSLWVVGLRGLKPQRSLPEASSQSC